MAAALIAGIRMASSAATPSAVSHQDRCRHPTGQSRRAAPRVTAQLRAKPRIRQCVRKQSFHGLESDRHSGIGVVHERAERPRQRLLIERCPARMDSDPPRPCADAAKITDGGGWLGSCQRMSATTPTISSQGALGPPIRTCWPSGDWSGKAASEPELRPPLHLIRFRRS
jgi:hypothetical protein